MYRWLVWKSEGYNSLLLWTKIISSFKIQAAPEHCWVGMVPTKIIASYKIHAAPEHCWVGMFPTIIFRADYTFNFSVCTDIASWYSNDCLDGSRSLEISRYVEFLVKGFMQILSWRLELKSTRLNLNCYAWIMHVYLLYYV